MLMGMHYAKKFCFTSVVLRQQDYAWVRLCVTPYILLAVAQKALSSALIGGFSHQTLEWAIR